jgi:hypothetical protein
MLLAMDSVVALLIFLGLGVILFRSFAAPGGGGGCGT